MISWELCVYCDECLSGSKSPSLARRSSDVKCNEYTLLLLFKIRQDCCSHHGNAIVALDDSLTEQLWKWNIRFSFVVKEHFLFSWQILWREWHKSIWAKIVLENVYWHATNVINKKLITLNYYIWQLLAIILFLYLSSNYLYKARDFEKIPSLTACFCSSGIARGHILECTLWCVLLVHGLGKVFTLSFFDWCS